jgi:hypothetical protein
MTRKAKRVYVRVEGKDEVDIGYARTLSDVPALLYKLADLLRSGMSADALEPASEAVRPSS